MTTDAYRLMQAWLQGIWRLFTSWHIPGMNFTPAQWLFFLIMAPITVKLVKGLLTLGLADYFSREHQPAQRMGNDNSNGIVPVERSLKK